MQASSWILIGGTGQEFGTTAATLALIGAVPIPERVLLIDADRNGELFRDLELALDLVRHTRLTSDEKSEPLVVVQPLAPTEQSVEVTLRQTFGRDPHLEALYAPSRIDLNTREGFKAEPQVGAASFFGPAFNKNSEFRTTLAHIQNAGGHIVTVVASVAGGTGSGLWQLVTRLVRKLLPNAQIRLLLVGPLLSLQGTDENDADGDKLSDPRLDANAAAGLRVALKAAELPLKERPFNELYLLGYPRDVQRPKAPKERTARRPSRMTLVAATVLTHRPPSLPDHAHPGVFVFGEDVGPRSTMSGIVFTRVMRDGSTSEVPVSELAFLVAQTRRRLTDLKRTRVARATSRLALFRRRQLGAVPLSTIEKSSVPAAKWQVEIRAVTTTALALLERFARWLSDDTDKFPHALTSAPDKLVAVHAVPHWQRAVDAAGANDTNAAKHDFHVRRWACAVGPAHLLPNAAASQVDAERAWLLPVDIAKQPSKGGWNRLSATDVHTQFSYRSESFPTPFARAYWNHQNLGKHDLTPEQQVLVNGSIEDTRALWLGLAGGVVEVVLAVAPSLSLNDNETDISMARVCAFIEEGRFFRDSSGNAHIPFLRTTVQLGGTEAGALVGAVHPISGPFVGPKYDGLAALIGQEVAPRREMLGSLLAYWLESVRWKGNPPAWSATVPAGGTAIPPGHVQARMIDLQLDGIASYRTENGEAVAGAGGCPFPFVGATPRVLQLVNTGDRGHRTVIPSVLPSYSREDAEARFLRQHDATTATFKPPHVAANKLSYEGLPGAPVVHSVAGLEDLEDWNIEVFPGDKAPADWKEFGVAVEPAGGNADHKRYDVVIYVDDDRGGLRPVASDGASWPEYWWVTGRPRLICITRKATGDAPACVGFFPLLGPTLVKRAHGGISITPTATISLDLGTSRSFVAVQAEDRLKGAPFSDVCKVVARSNAVRNVTLGGYTHWHPSRSLAQGSELGRLFDADNAHPVNPILRDARVMLLPSNLVRRRNDAAGGPFVGFTISPAGVPPEAEFMRIRDLKWSTTSEDLIDYLTLVLMTAVAQLDQHLQLPPLTIDIRMSYPLAFTPQHRSRMKDAVQAAKARVEATTRAVCAVRYLDESMAGMYYVGLSHRNWKLSIDLGGGTTDLALMYNSRMVVIDSVRIGGDLVMARAAAALYPSDAADVAMNKLGQDLHSGTPFARIFNHKAPELAMQLLALAEDYAARLLAGAIIQVERGDRPGWIDTDEFEELRQSLTARKIDVSLFIFGGAWRLAPLVHDFEWSAGFDRQIQEAIGSPLTAYINQLIKDAGQTTQVRVVVEHQHLHRPGGEKAAVALGLLDGTLTGNLSADIADVHGIRTVNGLDETFEGRARQWFEWVGKKHDWRNQSTPAGIGEVTSQPTHTPEFMSDALRDWSLATVLASDRELPKQLTPTKGNPLYDSTTSRQRLRGAMGTALEVCFRHKYETR